MPRPGRWKKRILIGLGAIVVVIIGLTALGLATGSPKPAGQHRRPVVQGLIRLRYGQKAVFPPGWTGDGIASATVYSLRLPFKSQTLNKPDAGDQFALGSIQVCAGTHGADTSTSLVPFPFSLVFPHRQTTGALDVPDAAREPDLGNSPSRLRPRQCVRGYLTFEYQKKSPPLSVGFGSPDDPAYEWTAAG